MLHYLLHASEVPWQDQLLYAGLIVAAIALIFGGLWWRKRAARPRQGDFAALVEQGNVAQALAAQGQSPMEDAADAWRQTQHTLQNVKSGVERVLALIWALLSGLLCAISVSAVISNAWNFPAVDWALFAFYAVLGGVCAWFTRVQWRDFRGRK
jgi:Flp pilus assembly protein TadB